MRHLAAHDKWPGISRTQALQMGGVWDGRPMPRPYERSKPLGLDAKTKLLGYLHGHVGKMLDADPTHTFHTRNPHPR